MNGPTFLDLFCGCGGFSLGMTRAGFRCLAAIDFNEHAITTFKANFKDALAIEKDLTKFSPSKLASQLGVNEVDVIVGGPPCQGFSTVRQVDAANHGSRVRKDKRRYLFRAFLDYVSAFRPRAFVMENVLGIQSAAKGKFFTLVQAEARQRGYRVHTQVEEAWILGVPQKRRRQLIIGVRNDIPGYFPSSLRPAKRAGHALAPKLWDAIGDLPPLSAGEGLEECDYDLDQRRLFLATRGPVGQHYLEKVLEVQLTEKLTAHRARPHSSRDLRDFNRLREGEHAADAIARGEAMEFPYKRSVFRDRYTRQSREGLCSTIVAHLSKDGLMFVHPSQLRSLTVREAARVQSFPDWFKFPVARTHQFRIIGNAVPPLVAEAVAEELRSFLEGRPQENTSVTGAAHRLPENDEEAKIWLSVLIDLSTRALRKVDPIQFRQAWHSIAFLCPGLHPDSARDHGDTKRHDSEKRDLLPGRIESRLLTPYYERSGWPVVLAPIAREAWRRFRNGEFNDDDLYCLEAQMAGMRYRDQGASEVLRQWNAQVTQLPAKPLRQLELTYES